ASVDERMALLDLRSESCIALGDLGRAAADAAAMKTLARADGDAGLQARALSRDAIVQVRKGDARAAAVTAATAVKAAEISRQPAIIALALSRLSQAQTNARTDLAAGLRNA